MVLSSMFELYLLLIKICFMVLYSVSLSVSLSGYVINRLTSLSPTLTFTIEPERNKCVNLHDITIRNDQKISFQIYRKPTATDIIIPRDSNHRPEHKQAAIKYLVNRLITYPLNDTNKETEYNTIKQILINNKYNSNILDKTIQTVTTNQ